MNHSKCDCFPEKYKKIKLALLFDFGMMSKWDLTDSYVMEQIIV